MIVFAAGNKYKMYQGQEPKLILNEGSEEGNYFAFAFKWIKSKQEWRTTPSVYNIGSAYEVVEV